MKILILFHSETGNTKAFAQGIQGKLTGLGHSIFTVQLETKAEVKKASFRDKQEIEFTNLPDPQDYDVVLFGGPVWAFGPSPVIMAAISQMGDLSGKICLRFATMAFFCRFLGGSAALKHMRKALEAKGAQIAPGFLCYGMRGNLPLQIEKKAAQIAAYL